MDWKSFQYFNFVRLIDLLLGSRVCDGIRSGEEVMEAEQLQGSIIAHADPELGCCLPDIES